MTTPLELYAERRKRFQDTCEALAARSRSVSNLRGLSFGLLVVAAITAFVSAPHRGSALIVAALAAVAFAVLVIWHQSVIAKEDEARRWAQVNRDAHARAGNTWRELPNDGRRFRDINHPYSEDLDLFGRASLFQRVSVAHTRYGEETLASWFREPAEASVLGERQGGVRALAPELETRQRLEALALSVIDDDGEKKRAGQSGPPEPPDPEPLLKWAESTPVLSAQPLYRVAAILLPLLNVGALAAASVFSLPAVVWVAPIVLSLVVNQRARDEVARVFSAVSASEGAFLRYAAMLELAEQLDLDAPAIKRLREQLRAGGQAPSRAMHDFRSAVGWFELKYNGLIHPFANVLLLWDLNCVLKLEGWQTRAGKNARAWFRVLGELEALSSLAGLAHDCPDWTFPELAAAVELDLQGLGHPLIDEASRVSNDVALPAAGTALLITGSNMSGKSTLLRAIGLCCVMGLSGAPVCARRVRLAALAVRTSIRISDSLESGVSHFYAELRKLKAVVDATHGDMPVLFLLDEVLHGTNSRERQIGARWVLSELLERGALGAASTHDMGLAELDERLMERVTLVHFRESVQDNKMTFDYKLRPGPVTSGNALRLMQIIGLNVPLDQASDS